MLTKQITKCSFLENPSPVAYWKPSLTNWILHDVKLVAALIAYRNQNYWRVGENVHYLYKDSSPF